MEKTILTTFKFAEFKDLIKECVQETLLGCEVLKPTYESTKQIYSRQETAKLLDISLPTLHNYTQQGYIKAFRLGHKVRYKLEDIYTSLTAINVGGRPC